MHTLAKQRECEGETGRGRARVDVIEDRLLRLSVGPVYFCCFCRDMAVPDPILFFHAPFFSRVDAARSCIPMSLHTVALVSLLFGLAFQ